jgi:hypothetical protein
MLQFETLRLMALVHGMRLTRMGGDSTRTFILNGPKGTFQCFGLDAVNKRIQSFRA